MKKKIIAIAMLAAVTLSSFAALAGCGGGATPDPQPSTTTSSPAVASTTHTLHGKNFSVPSSWTKEVNGDSTIFRANLAEFLFISCIEVSDDMDFSVANTYYSSFAQSFTSIDNTKCTAPEAITIGNITWYHMALVGTIQDMLGTYKMDSYVAVVDGVLWSVSMTAYTTAATDYSQILKDIVSSVSSQASGTTTPEKSPSTDPYTYLSSQPATLKSDAPQNASATQHEITVSVTKVEHTQSDTRVHVKVDNQSDEKCSIYTLGAGIVQDGRQIVNEFNSAIFGDDHDDLASSLLPGTYDTGIFYFPAIDSSKDFTFFIDVHSQDYSLDFDDFMIEIKAK